MDIVFDIDSAFHFAENEKMSAYLEKPLSKCLLDISKQKKIREKKSQKTKKNGQQGIAKTVLLSKELVYQWRLIIAVLLIWLFEYGDPPLKDGEGWKVLTRIKVSKSENSENIESKDSKNLKSEKLESDTVASSINNPITTIRIRIARTLLHQFIERRLTTRKIHFVIKAKKNRKGIVFLFEMVKDTDSTNSLGWKVL
jgi:hypothetical protein